MVSKNSVGLGGFHGKELERNKLKEDFVFV